MKTASLPPLRVAPELRSAAENVLRKGETLSAFIEESLRKNIEHRLIREEFISKALASRENARKSGQYYPSEDVVDELANKLSRARTKATK